MPLILFVVLALVVLVAFELRERKRSAAQKQLLEENDNSNELQEEKSDSTSQSAHSDEACCGSHLVCERETLLITKPEIIYYDDEELDRLADKDPKSFTDDEYRLLRDVFDTLKEEDLSGWCRSLQLRHIDLPEDIKDEALLILRELRHNAAS